ncbi:uncharacterized protein CDAR_422621 [Caerostris darwini]|uniref:Uncharacterized protein n=1 Tax=Caerostris darwini TaxID=1538125 RepID=A0AAV4QTK5_9ARAC|nr:uncharacterized protein CDAR_422621 [Caerostris darwini]
MAEEIYRENVWNSVSTQCETIHEPSKTEKQMICFKGRKAWKLFKYIVFVLCTSCLIYQSVEFCAHYYTYPDAINFAVKSKIFTLPAVTVCDKNSIERSIFCEEFPHYCQYPINRDEFCEKHPHFCKENITIPMHGYHTKFHMRVTETSQKYFKNHSREDSRSFRDKSKAETVIVTDEEYATFVKCFSSNLHIDDEDEPDVKNILNSSDVLSNEVHLTVPSLGKGDRIFHYTLRMLREEEFHPWDLPQAFIAVHSPYVPSNPIADGSSMELGYEYELYVRLEENHLLPAPYQTNCTDYIDLWRKNNRTGARSQAMCKELCTLKFSRDCFDCDRGLTMFRDHDKWCKEERFHCSLMKALALEKSCQFSCNPDCLKLKYVFTMKRKAFKRFKGKQKEENRNKISIRVYVKDPEIFVQSHTPLYGNWELFSYIGGLMGCWLGISVWTFVGILEFNYLRALQFIKNFRKKSKILANGVDFKAKLHSF